MSKKLLVSSIFGPVFQGEGRNVGQRVVFIRLAHCNQHCVFCDTPETWRFSNQFPHHGNKVYDVKSEVLPYAIPDVIQEVNRLDQLGVPSRHVVISGGEPLLQAENFDALGYALTKAGFNIEVETAGTLLPLSWNWVSQWNVSPKLSNSGNPVPLRFRPEVLREFRARRASFKFVVETVADFGEIDALVSAIEIPPHTVYIMPEGIDAGILHSRLPLLVPEVLKRGFNLSPRFHIEIFGNQRNT